MEKREVQRCGSIYIDVPAGKDKKRNGAKYLRDLVGWMNNRKESLNDDKSLLDLIDEYNKFYKG